MKARDNIHWLTSNRVVRFTLNTVGRNTEQVFFSDLNSWKPYREALLDPLYKNRVINLIREWKALSWREHMAEKS